MTLGEYAVDVACSPVVPHEIDVSSQALELSNQPVAIPDLGRLEACGHGSTKAWRDKASRSSMPRCFSSSNSACQRALVSGLPWTKTFGISRLSFRFRGGR